MEMLEKTNNQIADVREDPVTVSILWTGGWDSTFRVVELSRQNVIIQPIYVIDQNRASRNLELESMHRIVAGLESKKETKATFLPIKLYKIDDIPPDPAITAAYNTIHAKTRLGTQHEWLARLGKILPGLEMGTELGTPETSHIINAIETYCVLETNGTTGIINREKSSHEGNLVLGWFTFPIITRTEEDMLEQIKAWGYEDIMKMIWFCHNPINEKPCGFCHPCEVKMESNMAWLLPEKAQKRYNRVCKLKKKYGSRVGNLYIKTVRAFHR